MKKFSIITVFLLTLSCKYLDEAHIPGLGHENINAQFVEGSQDIPLASGLTKIDEDAISFDSPAGSVLSISYKSKKDLERIRDFYTKTLPQMGWKAVKKDQPSMLEIIDFERGNEKLEIEFVNRNGQDLVKFYAELGI